jgi:hypothetical protein
MRQLAWAAALAFCLAGCGGANGPASKPQAGPFAASPQRAGAPASPYGQALPWDAAEQLLNFGEAHFGEFFPSHQKTSVFLRYHYRFYPQTGTYLAVAIGVVPGDGLVEGGIYAMGGRFGGTPVYFGVVSSIIPTAPTLPKPTSYANTKNIGLPRIKFPPFIAQPAAWGAADFFHTGTVDLFTARQNYKLSAPFATVVADPNSRSDLQFWRQSGDGTSTLLAGFKGCLHPRKALVADFNQDGWPDVFVACHGYDAPVNGLFPGEKNTLLLSDGQGGFTVSEAGPVGFYHGAAAADVDGDGYPDVVVADIQNPGAQVHFLMNQRNGAFTVDNTRVPGLNGGPYFSVEMLDVDGDGLLDLIVGGHETYPGAPGVETAILYGDVNGVFGATKTVVAPVFGRGAALDFTLVTNNGQKFLYVDRTSLGNDPGTTFYGMRTLQAFNLASGASAVLLDVKADWIRWWLPATRDGQNGVVPYDLANPDYFFSL